jgi:hypothetical protein
MSAYMDGPWRCGSGGCRGKEPDCGAKARNKAEAHWISTQEAMQNAQAGDYDPYISALLFFLGEPGPPEINIRAARHATSRIM